MCVVTCPLVHLVCNRSASGLASAAAPASASLTPGPNAWLALWWKAPVSPGGHIYHQSWRLGGSERPRQVQVHLNGFQLSLKNVERGNPPWSLSVPWCSCWVCREYKSLPTWALLRVVFIYCEQPWVLDNILLWDKEQTCLLLTVCAYFGESLNSGFLNCDANSR